MELALTDGRIVSAPGLDFGDDSAAARAVVLTHTQAGVRVAPLAGQADRWGRVAARIATAQGDLAEALLAQGLARYRPEAAAKPCRAGALAAESVARTAGVGLWATRPALAGADRAGLAAAPAGLTVVEGVVESVGEGPGRLYINFGPIRAVDFAVTISRRNLAILEAVGIDAKDLTGWRLRVRGLLDRRAGVTMEISDPDAIETLEPPATRPPDLSAPQPEPPAPRPADP